MSQNSRAEVKRDSSGKVWIDGVPRLGWDFGKQCTFAGSLWAALAVTDHSWTYEDLMGVSALAFRTRWWRRDAEPGWCPSNPVGELPEEMAAITSLFDARLSAVQFLEGQADRLEGEASEALARAAEPYDQERKLPGQTMQAKDAFLGPWSGKEMTDWTDEVRAREQEVLSEAREIETLAVAQLERALATLEG